MRTDNRGEQVLTIPRPPSVNALYKNVPGKGRVKTKEYRQWIKEAGWILKAQGFTPMTGWVAMSVRVVKPDRRKRDLMNIEKALSDLLVSTGVIEDDRLITVAKFAWTSADLEGVSITLKEVAEYAEDAV